MSAIDPAVGYRPFTPDDVIEPGDIYTPWFRQSESKETGNIPLLPYRWFKKLPAEPEPERLAVVRRLSKEFLVQSAANLERGQHDPDALLYQQSAASIALCRVHLLTAFGLTNEI
jgi:hypothetical protein